MSLALDPPVVRDEHDMVSCVNRRAAVSDYDCITGGDCRGARVDRDASAAGHVHDDVALVGLLRLRDGAVLRDDDLRSGLVGSDGR
ncbi:hypothetical protein HYS42_00870 [Candidatus Saccharibacteria bacterium]|nr:hypothetical protein [Candidatus Saccharibacteria bacterium]